MSSSVTLNLLQTVVHNTLLFVTESIMLQNDVEITMVQHHLTPDRGSTSIDLLFKFHSMFTNIIIKMTLMSISNGPKLPVHLQYKPL